jgi:hypothetical protein
MIALITLMLFLLITPIKSIFFDSYFHHVIARDEAIANFTERICMAALPLGDYFVSRNDGVLLKPSPLERVG